MNAFQDAVKRGRLISNVSIETVESADDDWIIFEFGERDPAVLPFVVPQTGQTNRQ
jgi:ABC-type Fe3+-hydroxamate transport system substrate-binding protein